MSIGKIFSKENSIFSVGTKIVIFSMALDFFAWGLIDPFFSTYAASLLNNLFLVGLLVATKGFVGLLSLSPLSQTIHHISPRFVGIMGRIGCVFAVLSYAAGGFLTLPLLLFVGAIFHGFSGAARDIATREYLMESSSKNNASTILGTNFSVFNTAWMTGSILCGVLLMWCIHTFAQDIPHFVPFVLLACIPIFLASAFLLRKLPKKTGTRFPFAAYAPQNVYQNEKKIFLLFSALNLQLKFSVVLICFLQMIRSALLLFLPLLAFQLELSVFQVGLLMAAMHAPLLLSALFSVFEDRTDRMLFIIGGLLFSVIPLLLLSQVSAPLLIGISTVLTSLSLAIIMPANLGTIAANTKHSDAPLMAALQVMSQRFGMLFGSLIIGTVSQIFGIASAFLLIAFLAISFALFALFVRFHFQVEKKVVLEKNHLFHIHPLHPHLFHIHHQSSQ
jgi:MFS family permease